MKKILIVCTTDSMIWNFLIPHILFLEKYGIKCECACSKTGFYYDELIHKYNLIVHKIDFERKPLCIKNLKAFVQLVKLVHRNKYDIIYGHEPVGGAMARLAGKINKKYVMYLAHGFHFFNGAPIKHWLLYFIYEFVLSLFSDSIITICKEDYNNSKKLLCKKIYNIPGIGVDYSKYKTDELSFYRKKYREEFNVKDDEILIVSVGELSIRKNHKIVIEALANIKSEKIKLLICGEGVLLEQLKKLVGVYKLEERIIFAGFRRDIPFILYSGDIFVFPSKWEGLGLAGIEAMYCYLPVIGSNRQGIKDYVIDNHTGYLFEPDNITELTEKINILVNDKMLRKKFGCNGHDLVEKYNLNHSLESLEKIYKAEKII